MTDSFSGRSLRGAFVAVTSLFIMWGFITVLVDALIPRLKDKQDWSSSPGSRPTGCCPFLAET